MATKVSGVHVLLGLVDDGPPASQCGVIHFDEAGSFMERNPSYLFEPAHTALSLSFSVNHHQILNGWRIEENIKLVFQIGHCVD